MTHTVQNMQPNKGAPVIRRCAFPFNAGRQFGRAFHAPPSLSVAVDYEN
jgi:hypothetical protein